MRVAQAGGRAQPWGRATGSAPPVGLSPLSAIASIPLSGTEKGAAFTGGRQAPGEHHLGRG